MIDDHNFQEKFFAYELYRRVIRVKYFRIPPDSFRDFYISLAEEAVNIVQETLKDLTQEQKDKLTSLL